MHCLVLLNDDTVGLQTGRLVQSTKIVLLVSASKSNIQDVCSYSVLQGQQMRTSMSQYYGSQAYAVKL